MVLFKKRGTAVAVLALVIVFGTLFGVHRSVGKESKRIEQQFFDGVYLEDGKYTQVSISEMLDERENNALGAVTVSGNYDVLSAETDALRSAREKLIGAETIEEKYIANCVLTKAADELRTAASGAGLDERDAEGLAMYLNNMDSAQKVIDASAYNGKVRDFINVTMRQFPVRLLKDIAFCKYPSYFNVEG